MSKLNRRKSRIKLNETLNKQLDSMEDSSALDVFKPKESKEFEFIDMINEAIQQEEIQKKSKNGNKLWTSVKNNSSLKKIGGLFLALVFCCLFIVFVYLLFKFIIL